MELIILIVIVYLIVTVIDKIKSSSSSNNNSTISEVDTGEYITLDEYDKISRNNPANKNIDTERLIGIIMNFDNSKKVGSIVCGNDIYEIIFQRNFNYNTFPNHMPKVNDKVIFKPQRINEKVFASNIEYYRSDIISNESDIHAFAVPDNSLQNMLESFANCNNLMEITDSNSYHKVLRIYYEKYGNIMLNLGVIIRFLHTYHLDKKLNKNVSDIQHDLETIANGEKLPNEKIAIYKLEKWKELISEFPDIEDAEDYLNILEVFFLTFGFDMFDKNVINEFIKVYKLDIKFHIGHKEVIKELHNMYFQSKRKGIEIKKHKWLKWDEMETDGKTINDYKSYKEVLKQYYLEYGQNIDAADLVNFYKLKSRFGIGYFDVINDLKELDKPVTTTSKHVQTDTITNTNKMITDYESYKEVLKQNYSKFGEEMFLPSKIHDFIEKYKLNLKWGIQSEDVVKDLWEIRNDETEENTHVFSSPVKTPIKQTQTVNNTLPVQTQHKQMDNIPSVQTQYKQTNNIPSVQIQHKQEDMAKRTAEYQRYMDSLKQYYVKNKGKVFDFSHIYSFIKEHNLDVRYDIKLYEVFADLMTIGLNYTYKLPCSQDIEDIKFMLRFFKETHGVTIKYNGETCETLLEKGILQVIDFSSTKPPVQEQRQQTQNANNILLGYKQNKQTAIKQTQTVNNTPPVQTQSKQIQTINNNVQRNPGTLDEYMLIDIVRNMPLWLNSESVNISEYSLVIEMCTRIVKETIPGIMAGKTLMQYEDIIRQKRLRTSNKAEYDRQIENDIFYELFCYSYLINVFEAVTGKLAPDKLDMILNVDLKNYISLVENECKKRVQNLESEKKHIHSIEVISKKYAQVSTQYKMPTLGFINQRENDFIIASLMHRGMISSIAPFFGDDKVEWQFLYIIPAQEFAQTLDIYFSQAISMRLSLYTGDKLFKDLTL